jgi:hypothetical protein
MCVFKCVVYSRARNVNKLDVPQNCVGISISSINWFDMATIQTLRAESALLSYHQVPETKFERTWSLNSSDNCATMLTIIVNWADLATLDLSIFDTPGGKEKLAKQLFDAIDKIGMFPGLILAILICSPDRLLLHYQLWAQSRSR